MHYLTHTKTYLSDVFNIKLDIKSKLNVMFRKHCFLGNRIPAQAAQSTSKTGSFLVSAAKEVYMPLDTYMLNEHLNMTKYTQEVKQVWVETCYLQILKWFISMYSLIGPLKRLKTQHYLMC